MEYFLPVLIFTNPALAAKLEVAADAHWSINLTTNALLYAHIGTGLIGILMGIIASIVVKGSLVHRMPERLFSYPCYVFGEAVAPFLETQQSTNFVAAALALYLLISGVYSARLTEF